VAAVELSTPVCSELTRAGAAIKKTTNPLHMQMFWIPPNIAHVSVLHTGRVREDMVALVAEALEKVVSETEPFALKVLGLRLYEEGEEGREKRLRAIWAGIEDSQPLLELRGRLVESLADFELQVDPDPYEPHVPLALVDQFRNTREFNSAFVEWQDRAFGEVRVEALLFKKANPTEGTTDEPFSTVNTLCLKQE